MRCVLVMPVSPGGLEASIELCPESRLPNRIRREAGRCREFDPGLGALCAGRISRPQMPASLGGELRYTC